MQSTNNNRNRNRNGSNHPKKKQKLSVRSLKSNSSSSSIEILNSNYSNHNNHYNHRNNTNTNNNPSFYGLSPKNGNIVFKKAKPKKKKYNIYANGTITDHNGFASNHDNHSNITDYNEVIPFSQERDRRKVHTTDDYGIHNSHNLETDSSKFSRISRKSKHNESFNDR